MVSTFQKQIRELEAERDLLASIRERAVSEGGKLTTFGQDLVHTFLKHGFSNGDIAKIIGVTTSAISQRARKLSEE